MMAWACISTEEVGGELLARVLFPAFIRDAGDDKDRWMECCS